MLDTIRLPAAQPTAYDGFKHNAADRKEALNALLRRVDELSALRSAVRRYNQRNFKVRMPTSSQTSISESGGVLV